MNNLNFIVNSNGNIILPNGTKVHIKELYKRYDKGLTLVIGPGWERKGLGNAEYRQLELSTEETIAFIEACKKTKELEEFYGMNFIS